MDIRSVGVIGAGQMGSGIAHVFALAGFEVWLNDLSEEALERGFATIEKNLGRQVARGLITADDRDAALARLHRAPDLATIGPCDLVIESATEREDIKHKIFEDLAPHL